MAGGMVGDHPGSRPDHRQGGGGACSAPGRRRHRQRAGLVAAPDPDGPGLRRTRTGRAFAELGFGGRLTIQPRMAVAVVEAGVEVTDRVLAEIQRAERDGMSLREFTAALTGRAWADTPEGASEATVEAIVTAQPEAAGRAVARNATALRATDNERVALNPTVLGRPPETADGKGMRARLDAANDAEARLSQPIYQAAVLLAGVSEVWDEVWPDLSEVERRQVDRTLGEVLVTIESLRMRLGLEVS